MGKGHMGPPPRVEQTNRQTCVKTLHFPHTTYAGGNYSDTFTVYDIRKKLHVARRTSRFQRSVFRRKIYFPSCAHTFHITIGIFLFRSKVRKFKSHVTREAFRSPWRPGKCLVRTLDVSCFIYSNVAIFHLQ